MQYIDEDEAKRMMLKAQEARIKLNNGDYKTEEERQELFYTSHPWETTHPTIRSRLSIAYFEGYFYIYDLGGFLTCVATQETLGEILRNEAETPGVLRSRLTHKPIGAARKTSMEEAKAKSNVKTRRFKGKKEQLDLDDLGL